MAAPMARVSCRLLCNAKSRNVDISQRLCRQNERHTKDLTSQYQVRTFGCKICLQNPRALDNSRPTHGNYATRQSKARDGTTATSVNETSDFVDGEITNSVRIHGNSTSANDSFRKRQERESLQLDSTQTNTAKHLATKIRQDLILKRKNVEKKGEEKIKTASKSHADKEDVVEQDNLQRSKGLDSQGFRTLWNQVQDLRKLDVDTVASILYRSIIYNEGDLIAIDKPYGLPSHGGPGVVHSIDSLLPVIAKKLIRGAAKRTDPDLRLYPVHRLDKETTGVMLLAKTEEMARHLHQMFIRHEVVKKYWVVTVGVPDPKDGVIDIPMAEVDVGSFHRMGIRPDIGAVYKDMGKFGRGKGTTAVTNFRVVSENGSAALVEVNPETGVKHQIRVHMALGMGCPVLGDHKYSHHNKLAPQHLPMDMLQCLGIRQAKARTVPMHLHAREIMLPEFLNGRNVFVSTTVPKFFVQNMKRLKLSFP
ncbi:pseudouridylate synthase RPUSD4, mitochondrial-like [Asterias amurensis]|uniref:pseudouridylate synthase RPUSD4, mitochondrial-like n=1 Tax=Asterias amurensis TaxID=7602 RepID=UPI003AB23885